MDYAQILFTRRNDFAIGGGSRANRIHAMRESEISGEPHH